MENLDEIVTLLNDLVLDAELIVKKNKEYCVASKGELDIVTDIDKLIEQHCIGILRQKYPNIPIISEETMPNTALENDAFFLDPLDGTKNFAYGLPTWGFQIAYVVNKNEPIASVIFLPELGIQVVSQKDKGTLVNGEKPCESFSKSIKDSLWIVEGKSKKWTIGKILSPQVLGVRSYGASSIALVMTLLKGACAIIYNIKTMWDIYPGLCACKNAGKICKMLDNGTVIVCDTQKQCDLAIKVIEEAE